MNSRLSDFQTDEKIVSSVGALISPQLACRVHVPAPHTHRSIYVFLEAITAIPGDDFSLDAEIRFIRNGSVVHSIPASIGENANTPASFRTTKLTAFANVATGQNENLFAKLATPLANGVSSATLSPQKVQIECDEVQLHVIGSNHAAANFSGWRALLAVRSSLVSL